MNFETSNSEEMATDIKHMDYYSYLIIYVHLRVDYFKIYCPSVLYRVMLSTGTLVNIGTGSSVM